MGRPAILWGPAFENVLSLGEFDNVRTGRVPREGSRRDEAPSGRTSAYTIGYDYTIRGQARWAPPGDTTYPVPASGTASSAGWQDFLDWARDKNAFRWVVDSSFPDAWVDGCYLVEPLEGHHSLEMNEDAAFDLVIRNPTYDFSVGRRGLFLDYAPGLDIAQAPWLSFSGTTVRTFSTARTVDPAFTLPILQYAPAGVPRDRDTWFGSRMLRLERTATNLVTVPEDMANAYWVKTECTVTNDSNDAPNRAKVLDTIIESVTASVSHTISDSVSTFTITADGLISATVYLQSSTRRARVYVGDAPTTNRLGVDVDLIAGTILANVVNGTGAVMKGAKIRTLTNGSAGNIREVSWVGYLGGGITTARFVMTMMDLSSNTVYTGDGASNVRMWGVTVVDGASAGIYPGASRTQEILTFKWPWPQQALWVYLKFVELGAVWHPTNGSRRLFANEVNVTGAHRFLFFNPTGGGRWAFFHDANAGPQAQATMGVDVPYGSVIELLGTLQADGSVKIRWSIDGAAEGSAGPSGAVPFGPGPWNSLVVGMNHGGTAASPLTVSEVGPMVVRAGWNIAAIDTIAKARLA